MESDPSLVARILEFFSAVVWNWKGLVAGVSLASGFVLQQLLPETCRQRIDKILPPGARRGVLIGVCLLLLGVSFFQVYDDVSTRLRHLSSQSPDFEKVTTWGVSFEVVGIYSGMLSLDNKFPFFLAFHRCRFVNLSATQKRILDIKVEIPTDDPNIPVVTLDTESMSFQEYRKSLTDRGVEVGESALGRKESLLQTPIDLGPAQLIQGTIEFDIHDDNVKQKMLNVHAEQQFSWLRLGEATVSVTDQRSDTTKTIKIGNAYNAVTGVITRIGEHYLLR
jgi:hypothetical protein